jgi:DNA-damage-inducible protein J
MAMLLHDCRDVQGQVADSGVPRHKTGFIVFGLDEISNEIQNWANLGVITVAVQTSMLHIRVDDDIKEQATLALTAMGMSVSDAVRLFLRRVVIDQAFPLELKVPNAETLAAMEESRAMMAERRVRFASADELFADLEKNSGQ